MRYFKHNFGTNKAVAKVQATGNFIRHLRQFLHLDDDAPIMLYGGLQLMGSGFGWYTIYAYNPNSKGQDIQFALTQLDLAVKWMHRKTVDEIRLLLGYNQNAVRNMTVADQQRVVVELGGDVGMKKDVAQIQQVQHQQHMKTARPASPGALAALQRRINNKYHTSSSVH
jgi:hypothetical protein